MILTATLEGRAKTCYGLRCYYFLKCSTQLANHCVKWVWLLDCWVGKLQKLSDTGPHGEQQSLDPTLGLSRVSSSGGTFRWSWCHVYVFVSFSSTVSSKVHYWAKQNDIFWSITSWLLLDCNCFYTPLQPDMVQWTIMDYHGKDYHGKE